MADTAVWVYEVELVTVTADDVIDGGNLLAPKTLTGEIEAIQHGGVVSGSILAPVVLAGDLEAIVDGEVISGKILAPVLLSGESEIVQ